MKISIERALECNLCATPPFSTVYLSMQEGYGWVRVWNQEVLPCSTYKSTYITSGKISVRSYDHVIVSPLLAVFWLAVNLYATFFN